VVEVEHQVQMVVMVELEVLVVVVVDVLPLLALLVQEHQVKVFLEVLQQAHQKDNLEVVVELVKLVEQTELELEVMV
tara:strand:- start:167 stop:397 length:231 start_codon:yes stop_codon:yes gene_type:complete